MIQLFHSLAYAQRIWQSFRTDRCSGVIIAALFTRVRKRKRPKCPSAEELITKTCHLRTLERCSAANRNAFRCFTGKGMVLKRPGGGREPKPRKTEVTYSLSLESSNSKLSGVSTKSVVTTDTWKVKGGHLDLGNQ